MQELFALLIFLELHVDVLHVSVSVLFASFFFSTELKQLISSRYTLQLKKQPTLFYAVAKQSLKKIQANNVSITLMIFFAFFFFILCLQ